MLLEKSEESNLASSFGKKKKTLEDNVSCFLVSSARFLEKGGITETKKFKKYFMRMVEILSDNYPNKDIVIINEYKKIKIFRKQLA